MLLAFTPRLRQLHDLVHVVPVCPITRRASLTHAQDHSIVTSIGTLAPPLGALRLKAIHILSVLLSSKNAAVHAEVARLGTLNTILDLFLAYPENSFLHGYLRDIVLTVIPTDKTDGDASAAESLLAVEPLFAHLFNGPCARRVGATDMHADCRLLQRILMASEGGVRKGYHGHLVAIANAINSLKGGENDPVKLFFSADDQVRRHSYSKILKQRFQAAVVDQWNAFTAGQLDDYNKKNSVLLVCDACCRAAHVRAAAGRREAQGQPVW